MFDKAPPEFRAIIDRMYDANLLRGINTFMDRRSEFRSPEASILAGIAKDRMARSFFEERLDQLWNENSTPPDIVLNEVIIGAGLHAAIYSSVRVAEGANRPIVLEGGDRVGGIFAVTEAPSFFLNSRNRPGTLGLPGQESALNVIPGGSVQPADLSGDEYQRNSDLSFCIRAALAMHSKVMPKMRVTGIYPREYDATSYAVQLDTGVVINAERVVLATGLGIEKPNGFGANPRVQTYTEFLKRLDGDFPLRGIGRAAVVGAGDSGKTVVEALLGQGPQMGYSVASLDYVERVDWYGVDSTCLTRETWEQNNRSRYKPLARLFPRDDGKGSFRVVPMEDRAQSIALGYESAYVNERPYDLVITCIGFESQEALEMPSEWRMMDLMRGGRIVARRVYDEAAGIDRDVYVIGPAAQIDVSDGERASSEALGAVPENSTALFRYADRTATLAASFTTNSVITEVNFNVTLPVSRDTDDSEVIAMDRDGNEIRRGDFIMPLTEDDPSNGVYQNSTYKVLGPPAENYETETYYIVIDAPGGFKVNVNGKLMDSKFGILSSETVKTKRTEVLGVADAEGNPLSKGDRVSPLETNSYVDVDESYKVLGIASERPDYIVLDAPGGFEVNDEETGEQFTDKYGVASTFVRLV